MEQFSILYEDKEIFLLNKPAGVAVQGGNGVAHPLDDEFSKQVGYRVHLVHRLDKETAGILIVAKTRDAASKWIKLIQTDSVSKEYVAVCVGEPFVNGKKMSKGTLRGIVEAHGREQSAETYFTVEKTAALPEDMCAANNISLSLLHITLGTGRMHQIRIQLAKANAPIAADDLHGNFKVNKLLRKAGIKKLHLAATKLTLPIQGKPQTFEIPLPEHMQKTVDLYFKN